MLRELVLAIGIPLLVLLLAVLALEQWGDRCCVGCCSTEVQGMGISL